jgi:deaminated glutathione amidase
VLDTASPNSDRSLSIAITQWRATRDFQANLRTAVELIGEAGSQGAELVVLPENGLFLGTNTEMRAAALAVDGPEIAELCLAASRATVAVVVGGLKRRDRSGKIYNTALVINNEGKIAGGYDKIHLFDATISGQSFEATRVESRGQEPVAFDINGIKLGLTICYDIRFPELYRRLAMDGAEVLLIPSAFTYTTGAAHWEVLARARAIENGAYVVASATVRGSDGLDAFPTFGHALIVDPWGRVVTDLGEAIRACCVVRLDMAKVAEAREKLPVLKGVQPMAYAAQPRLLNMRSGTDELQCSLESH